MCAHTWRFGFLALHVLAVWGSLGYEDLQRNDTVQFVLIVFRHGDRTPLATFPTDSWGFLWDENSLGELTLVGKQQGYDLGNFLHQRYVGGFLSTTYTPSEIYTRSTGVRRTLSTAYNVLAGLYPPKTSHPWSQNDPWVPIPVYTVPKEMDYLLFPSESVSCPVYWNITWESATFKNLREDNKDFMEFISLKTGSDVSSVDDLLNVYDVLVVERYHKLKRPDWASEAVVKRFDDLKNKYLFELPMKTTQQKRLRGGTFAKSMLDYMEMAKNGSAKKMVLYSAHDDTVSSVLNLMGAFNGIAPTYTAAVIVELHTLANQDYFIKVLYRNSTSRAPYELTLPNCSSPCPFQQFKEMLKDFATVDIDSECYSESDD